MALPKIFNGARMTVDKLPDLYLALRMLGDQRVLAGVPAERVRRQKGTISNAALAYIHENGAPEAHIPPRPYLVPAVAGMKAEIVRFLGMAGTMALNGNPSGVQRALNALGLTAQNRIRAMINAGVPPPLAASTLRGRIRARTAIKGAKAELARRDAGGEAGMDLAKPLIATGQLRNSMTYVIRSMLWKESLRVGKPGSTEKWNEQFSK